MTDLTIEQRRIRGVEAKQLLENPMMVEAFSALQGYVDSQALGCDPDNKDKAQRIVITRQLLAGLKREFTRIVEDGVVAEIQLSEMDRKRSFADRVLRR